MKKAGRMRGNKRAPVKRPAIGVWSLAVALAIAPIFLLTVRLGAQNPAGKDPAGSPAPASAASGNTRGQTAASGGKISVQRTVVDVPVTVLDKRGLPVITLDERDFKVYEDGKRQSITYFNRETPPPLRIGLIIDTSNSARPALKFEKEAASEFIYNILQGVSSENQIFLETFDSSSSIVQDFTNEADVLNTKLQSLKAGGGKAVYDAIYNACKDKMLTTGPAESTRHVLVLISDGLDIQSQHTLDEAISMAHRAETSIYTICNAAYGFSNPGDKYLDEIATQTGGEAFFPLRRGVGTDLLTGYLSHGQIDSMETNKGLGAESGIYTAERMIKLADSLDSIQSQLNNQYILGYTPTNGALDGTYRTIKVDVRMRDVSLHYKPGYFAIPERQK
jgi:Ca-activated chloride channel homolog